MRKPAADSVTLIERSELTAALALGVTLAEAQAKRENPTPFVVEIYPDSYHSFDLDKMPRYDIQGYKGMEVVQGNEEQAMASRARYLAWLAEIAP